MLYNCPLCRQKLDEETIFRVQCMNCNELSEGIRLEDLLDPNGNPPCKEGGCRYASQNFTRIKDDIMVSHDGCSATHPFQSNEDLLQELTEDCDGNSILFEGRKITHWQMGAFRRSFQAEHPNNKEPSVSDELGIWFPLVLLSIAKNGSDPGAKMVLLIGNQGAGKTIFALELLSCIASDENTVADLFLHIPAGRGGLEGEMFLHALDYYIAAGRGNRKVSNFRLNVEGSQPLVGDVKALFFKQGLVSSYSEGARDGGLFSVIKKFGENLSTSEGRARLNGYAQALVFYDTAGEWLQQDNANLRRFKNSVDHVVYIISIEECICEDPDDDFLDTLNLIIEGLSLVGEEDSSKAMVVFTKGDLIDNNNYLKPLDSPINEEKGKRFDIYDHEDHNYEVNLLQALRSHMKDEGLKKKFRSLFDYAVMRGVKMMCVGIDGIDINQVHGEDARRPIYPRGYRRLLGTLYGQNENLTFRNNDAE